MIGFYAAGAMGQGGAGGGFPEILSATVQNFDSATTDHNINLPATVNAGDLLLIVGAIYMFSDQSISSVGSGWTLHAQNWVNGPNCRSFLISRVANGTEGGGTVNVIGSAAREGAAFVYRIKAGTFHGDIAWNLTASAQTNVFAVASLSPAWGSAKTAWLANYFRATNSGAVTLPYPDNQLSRVSASGVRLRYGACTTLEEASDRPAGNFSLGLGVVHGLNTIAIRPA